MADDSQVTEICPDEGKHKEADNPAEGLAARASSPAAPDDEHATGQREQETQKPTQTLKVDFKWITDLLGVIATILAALSAYFSYLAVVEMRETNRLTNEAVAVSQRPWLSAELRVTEDLRFDNETGGSLGVEIILHNSGNTPAINARVHLYLVADVIGLDLEEVIRRQEALCGRFGILLETIQLGDVIPPGNPYRIEERAYLEQADIDVAVSKRHFGSHISPSLITCIEYRNSLNNKVHRTRYFSKVGPRSVGLLPLPLDPIGIHKDTKLWRWSVGQYAD
jgi:hypothetical protein